MKKALFCILLVFLCFSSVFTEDSVHKVKKGETLYSISKKYGITVRELCLSAGIKDTDVIKEGQLLALPKKEKKVTSEKKTDTYEVKAGDTLYSLAKKWDITVDTLKVMNMMAGNDTIILGQILIVPQKIDEKVSGFLRNRPRLRAFPFARHQSPRRARDDFRTARTILELCVDSRQYHCRARARAGI